MKKKVRKVKQQQFQGALTSYCASTAADFVLVGENAMVWPHTADQLEIVPDLCYPLVC